MEIPHEGPFCDLMWSDPEDIETWAMSPRGAGWLFGSKVTTEFNHINDISLIARAHQLVMDGFKYWFRDQNLVTVWSAPNYCYRCGNVASILNVNDKLDRTFDIFHALRDQTSRAIPYKTLVPYFLWETRVPRQWTRLNYKSSLWNLNKYKDVFKNSIQEIGWWKFESSLLIKQINCVLWMNPMSCKTSCPNTIHDWFLRVNLVWN